MRFLVATKTTVKQKHILVVNDAQEILDLLRTLLEDEGYRVSLYSYGPRDLEEIKEVAPDIIVLDLLIGEEDYGWQLLQKLHLDRDLASIPVVICTAAVRLVRELDGHLKAKGVHVVIKPFDIDDLLCAVNSSLEPTAAS